MPELNSDLFRGDPRLKQTLVSDPAHVVLGDVGEFVSKIQYAVLLLQGGSIGASELQGRRYGADTAKVVLAYKTRRAIVNPGYQKTADNIVGKMTIARLDLEMCAYELKEKLSHMNGVVA